MRSAERKFFPTLELAKSGIEERYIVVRGSWSRAQRLVGLGEAQENLKGAYDFWKNPKMYAPGN